MTGLVAALALLAVAPLLFIFGDLIHKGASSIDWNFFVKSPVPAGEAGGGVSNAIVGTIIIVALACLVGMPIGVGTGLFLVTITVNALARILVWRVAKGAAVGSKAL